MRCAELHKTHFGFVFQSYHLLDNLTVYESLEIPPSHLDIRKSDRDSLVADVVDRFQIEAQKEKKEKRRKICIRISCQAGSSS
jgi:ABC-type lipoprotein export system ATPase subunit